MKGEVLFEIENKRNFWSSISVHQIIKSWVMLTSALRALVKEPKSSIFALNSTIF